MYLIFDNLADAEERADQEGQYRGYSFWQYGIGTKWATSPVETARRRLCLRCLGIRTRRCRRNPCSRDNNFTFAP